MGVNQAESNVENVCNIKKSLNRVSNYLTKYSLF